MFKLFFWENAWPHKLHTKGRSFLGTEENSLCSSCSLDGTGDGGAPQGEHGLDPRVLAPVDCFDVHLQAVSARRSMAALLADKRLFSSMLGGLVHAQLRTGQEGFRTLGTL